MITVDDIVMPLLYYKKTAIISGSVVLLGVSIWMAKRWKEKRNMQTETDPNFVNSEKTKSPLSGYSASMRDRYVASMVLSGVGDALGFKNGKWEFCFSGPTIHKELQELGGLQNIAVKLPDWRISDDTVMHLATAKALIEKSGDLEGGTEAGRIDTLYQEMASQYKKCMADMEGRSPGATCTAKCYALEPEKLLGYQSPFDKKGGGCGAAMRAMCIGLRYPKPEAIRKLVAVSIESGRMTHHHPTGYLGALAAALFTSYAIQGKPTKEWGSGLMKTLELAKEHIKSEDRYVEENLGEWDYFTDKWNKYLTQRSLVDGKSKPTFPVNYGVEERDQFYHTFSFSGWAGASGHDAPIIAYDALLGAGDSWTELCNRGMFHYGDSDSSGVMAGAWFGALYGFKGVPEGNYKELEYGDKLTKYGKQLYEMSHQETEKVGKRMTEAGTGDDPIDDSESSVQESSTDIPGEQNNESDDIGQNVPSESMTETKKDL